MAVLVIAEHNHAALNPAVYSLVTAAQKIGGDIDIMITAQDGGKLAEEAAKINGIRRVLLSEAPYFAEELPENLVNAFVAIEDSRFWTHDGIDLRSIARAVKGVVSDDYSGGGSTITQQLIKNNIF